jgi:hypothetical protein
MVRNRNRRAVIAAIAAALWLGYMVVGLIVINTLMPTVEGEGPEGAAAFIGLVGGVFTMGLIMWWASD